MTVGVPGAEYTLYNEEGTALTTNTTNELGVIRVDNLKPGTYYFKETKAPDGFDINDDKISFTIEEGSIENSIGTLVTSDPKTVTTEPGTEEPGTGKPDTEEPGTEEPDTEEPDTEEPGDKDDNNGGLIVDPEYPTTDNNNNEGGLITNPLNPGTSSNGNNSTSESNSSKLPQTGTKSGLLASLLGFMLLISIAYINRRHA